MSSYGTWVATRCVKQDWRRFPVVAVSFEEARDYDAWLNRTDRMPGALLCTELEQVRAARDADARLVPGRDEIDADDADHDATYGWEPLGFGPDEVGSHPASSSGSPFGAHDMAGNVWERTISAEREDAPSLRGGSWNQGRLSSSSISPEPTVHVVVIGIGSCATPRL